MVRVADNIWIKFGSAEQQQHGGNFHSLLVRTHLNRKQKYHSEILLIFEGAEVSQEGDKRKDYGSGIDAEIKRVPTRFSQPLLLSSKVDSSQIGFTLTGHQCIFSSELTLLGNPFFSRTVKVSIEFCRLSKLVPFLASLRWCLVLSQSPDCSRRKLFSSSSIITLS